MLKVDHIQFLIGEKKILHDISATFESCKVHGIIGPNGSGKSTLLKNICRIWEPQAGTIFIDGKDYKSMPRKDLSKVITMVPQNTTIGFPPWTLSNAIKKGQKNNKQCTGNNPNQSVKRSQY